MCLLQSRADVGPWKGAQREPGQVGPAVSPSERAAQASERPARTHLPPPWPLWPGFHHEHHTGTTVPKRRQAERGGSGLFFVRPVNCQVASSPSPGQPAFGFLPGSSGQGIPTGDAVVASHQAISSGLRPYGLALKLGSSHHQKGKFGRGLTLPPFCTGLTNVSRNVTAVVWERPSTSITFGNL